MKMVTSLLLCMVLREAEWSGVGKPDPGVVIKARGQSKWKKEMNSGHEPVKEGVG